MVPPLLFQFKALVKRRMEWAIIVPEFLMIILRFFENKVLLLLTVREDAYFYTLHEDKFGQHLVEQFRRYVGCGHA